MMLQKLLDVMWKEYKSRTAFTMDIIPAAKSDITRVFKEAGVKFMFIKGSSLTYPHGYVRQMNDLDLIVENWENLFAAAYILEKHGFQHIGGREASWMTRLIYPRELGQEMVAHLSLIRQEASHSLSIDLHSTPLTIGPLHGLKCDMWKRINDIEPTIPSPEDKLLISIAHAASQGFYLVKDFNDVYAILQQAGETFDWEYFRYCANGSDISYAAYYVLKYVKQEYSNECIPERMLGELQQVVDKIRYHIIATTSRSSKSHSGWTERTIAQTLNALLWGRTNLNLAYGLRKALEYAIWSLRLGILHSVPETAHILQLLLHSNKNRFSPLPPSGQVFLLLPIASVCDNVTQKQITDNLYVIYNTLRFRTNFDKRIGIEIKPLGRTTLVLRLGVVEAILTHVDLFVPAYDPVYSARKIDALDNLIDVILTLIPKDTCREIKGSNA